MVSAKVAIQQAELALGSPSKVLNQYDFLKKLGWDVGVTPDSIIRLAARNPAVKSLVWC